MNTKIKLGELCTFHNGGAWNESEYSESGIAVVQVSNMRHDGTIDINSSKFLPESKRDVYKKHELIEGDLIIATVGSHPTQPTSMVGRASIVSKRVAGAYLNQNAVCIRPLDTRLDKGFLGVLGRSNLMRNFIASRARGGANQVRMAISSLKEFEFECPSLSKQTRISEIISAYDKSIENNNRRIELLEQMAMRTYSHLFKEQYTRLELLNGLPKGWEKKKVGEVLTKIPSRPKIKKRDYEEKGFVPIIDQSQSFIGGYTNQIEAKYDTPLPIIVFGDHTRILKYIDFPFARGADGTQLLYPNTENLPPVLFYYALKSIDLSNYAYARHFKFLKDQEIIIPDLETANKFAKLAEPIRFQIHCLNQKNEKIRILREAVLPRLIEGEIAL
ncbi:restriction endonuclease subunit S [Priestia aryabhattai]|uniref:restriction endonuclease subunit S n=1 Tax=Priestia aryabhattai TaxID=412384 RepID=UPI0023B0AF61|nr:restriction endonuclease subunit S [Priestia aryabhattai]MDE8674463.1 restriction endonuclease subunit S [Priestia aryabhattai]